MLKIVVLEADSFYAARIKESLQRIPSVQIQWVRTVVEFLAVIKGVRDFGVVVMDQYLNLIPIGASNEEFEAREENLKRKFPKLLENWNGQRGAEQLIRCMRAHNITMGVVIFTSIPKEHISSDVLADRHVIYCEKRARNSSLTSAVREALVGKE